MKLNPKQREQLKRPRPILFCVIIGLFCSPWLVLFGIDTYLRQQQVQTNLQAKAFFAQVPIHTSNPAAEQIDRLGARLGLNPNVSYLSTIEPDVSAAKDFVAIEQLLNDFLHSQSGKVSGPLDPLPAELERYINLRQPIIDEMQTYLLNNEAPRWVMDSDRMTDPNYPPPGFFNIRSLQKLLLLSAMQAHQQGRVNDVANILEASWQLNKTITERSDLSSQVLVAVISAQRASLLRHFDQVPSHWQARLQQQSQAQPIMKGVVFETWLRYRIQQNAWIPAAVAGPDASGGEKIRAMLANRFSVQSYFKLASLKNTQAARRALEQLTGLNVCTTPQVVVEKRLFTIETDGRNKGAEDAFAAVIAKRWQTAGMRSLSLELSHHVLQLKAEAQASGSWPIHRVPIASEACPGAEWVYTLHDDGSMSFDFSHILLSPSAIPLRYRSSYLSPASETAQPPSEDSSS
ncbi:MAG: hypothetical protein ACFB0D_22030 [Phormidesmis sp.]